MSIKIIKFYSSASGGVLVANPQYPQSEHLGRVLVALFAIIRAAHGRDTYQVGTP